MKLVRPSDPQPSNVVTFQCSMEMTEHDVKQYLEKIYKVPVKHIKMDIDIGEAFGYNLGSYLAFVCSNNLSDLNYLLEWASIFC